LNFIQSDKSKIVVIFTRNYPNQLDNLFRTYEIYVAVSFNIIQAVATLFNVHSRAPTRIHPAWSCTHTTAIAYLRRIILFPYNYE